VITKSGSSPATTTRIVRPSAVTPDNRAFPRSSSSLTAAARIVASMSSEAMRYSRISLRAWRLSLMSATILTSTAAEPQPHIASAPHLAVAQASVSPWGGCRRLGLFVGLEVGEVFAEVLLGRSPPGAGRTHGRVVGVGRASRPRGGCPSFSLRRILAVPTTTPSPINLHQQPSPLARRARYPISRRATTSSRHLKHKGLSAARFASHHTVSPWGEAATV
jgi:hypothetical protein